MRSVARAVAAVCGIAALVTLPPLGLLYLAGPPLPAHLPTTGDTVSRQAAIIEVTALAGWLCWATILIKAVAAAARRLPQLVRRLPHLHPPNPVRGLSAAVLGTVAVTAASSTAPPAAHATATTPNLHPTGGGTLPAALSPRPTTTVPATTVPATTVAAVASSNHLPVYQVNSGDWLGAVAERFLGDFNRYPDIADLNPDLIPEPSGPHGPDHIQPRWRLKLPPDAHDRGPRRHATGRPPGHRPARHHPDRSGSTGHRPQHSGQPQPAQRGSLPRCGPQPGWQP
jgi:hypothetical protein